MKNLAHLIKKKQSVTRAGRTFTTTVYVLPDQPTKEKHKSLTMLYADMMLDFEKKCKDRNAVFSIIDKVKRDTKKLAKQAEGKKYYDIAKKVGEAYKAAGGGSYKPKDFDQTVGDLFPEEFWFFNSWNTEPTQRFIKTPFADTYYNSRANKVNIDYDLPSDYKKLTAEQKKKKYPLLTRVLVHEYGHAYHFNTGLITEDGVNKAVDTMLKATGSEIEAKAKELYVFNWNIVKKEGDRIVHQTKFKHLPKEVLAEEYGEPVLDYIKLREYVEKKFKVKGIEGLTDEEREDAFVSFLDTMMAGNLKYGCGHDANYYVGGYYEFLRGEICSNRHMEWFAHSTENEFFRENPYLKTILPQTFKNMKGLWKHLNERNKQTSQKLKIAA